MRRRRNDRPWKVWGMAVVVVVVKVLSSSSSSSYWLVSCFSDPFHRGSGSRRSGRYSGSGRRGSGSGRAMALTDPVTTRMEGTDDDDDDDDDAFDDGDDDPKWRIRSIPRARPDPDGWGANDTEATVEIHRIRRSLRRAVNVNVNVNVHWKVDRSTVRDAFAVRHSHIGRANHALIGFLQRTTDSSSSLSPSSQRLLNQACIQAVRAAADVNNYNQIVHLVQACVDYSLPTPTKRWLDPRVFGEAIRALDRTGAGVSKLQTVWKALQRSARTGGVLTHDPTAHEINAMIDALSSRSKTKAALDVYRHNRNDHTHTQHNNHDNNNNNNDQVPLALDAYTASSLLTVLYKSLDQHHNNYNNSNNNNITQECWQWKEALSVLDHFEHLHQQQQQEKHQQQEQQEKQENDTNTNVEVLNNHVYAMVLKLNERLVDMDNNKTTIPPNQQQYQQYQQQYQHQDPSHNGAKEALSILRRMKHHQVSPDVVTCTTVLSTLDKTHQWKAALLYFNMMKQTNSFLTNNHTDYTDYTDKHTHHTHQPNGSWSLPAPNAFSYSTMMNALLRQQRECHALDLFYDDVYVPSRHPPPHGSNRTSTSTSTLIINTWVYNAALAACSGSRYGADTTTSLSTTTTTTATKTAKLPQVPTHSPHPDRRESTTDTTTRIGLAVSLVRQMEQDAQRGLDTAPNTVTYNTLLATLRTATARTTSLHSCQLWSNHLNGNNLDWNNETVTARTILDRMKRDGIARDLVTYHHALLACQYTHEDVLSLFQEALRDLALVHTRHQTKNNAKANHHAITFLLNTCLTSLTHHHYHASESTMTSTSTMTLPLPSTWSSIVSLWNEYCYGRGRALAVPDDTTWTLLLRYLSQHDPLSAVEVVKALEGDSSAADRLRRTRQLRLTTQTATKTTTSTTTTTPLSPSQYAMVLRGCIQGGHVGPALDLLPKVLAVTDPDHTAHNTTTHKNTNPHFFLNSIIRESVQTVTNNHTNTNTNNTHPRLTVALAICQSLSSSSLSSLEPVLSLRTITSVAKACAVMGQWDDALTFLPPPTATATATTATAVSRSLLSVCARTGDLPNALRVVDALQPHITSTSTTTTLSSVLLNEIDDHDHEHLQPYQWQYQYHTHWNYLMMAASQSKQWRVCLRIFQFLWRDVDVDVDVDVDMDREVDRDSVEPNDLKQWHQRHHSFHRAFLSTLRCLESCQQPAQVVALFQQTWRMEKERDRGHHRHRHQNRYQYRYQYRPPKDIVVRVCRTLIALQRPHEVLDVLQHVMNHTRVFPIVSYPSSSTNTNTNTTTTNTHQHTTTRPTKEWTVLSPSQRYHTHQRYGIAVYVGAMTALYRHGWYDVSDRVYLHAITERILPWPVLPSSPPPPNTSSPPLRIDLHGMTVAVAHSAVRVALQREVVLNEHHHPDSHPHRWTRDVMVITGRGKRSSVQHKRQRQRQRKPKADVDVVVLRPEVQRLLTEEFYPPLSTVTPTHNLGALVVPAADVDVWLSFQRTQRNQQMRELAARLTTLTQVPLRGLAVSLSRRNPNAKGTTTTTNTTITNITTTNIITNTTTTKPNGSTPTEPRIHPS